MKLTKDLAERIKRLLAINEVTQVDIAIMLGVSKSKVNAWVKEIRNKK